MSTRGQVYVSVYDDNKMNLYNFYRHFDSYPSCCGTQLLSYDKEDMPICFFNNDMDYSYEEDNRFHGDIEYLYFIDTRDGIIYVLNIYKDNQNIYKSEKEFLSNPTEFVKNYKNFIILTKDICKD